ncbi:hypothetical protein H8356DRAFT_1654791 [Neocallimastix lanati (nom. inval.)]|nr:hypothetical protein H8356DRAFT_1654791 [Neocallimastix sp. JGI-2020a]
MIEQSAIITSKPNSPSDSTNPVKHNPQAMYNYVPSSSKPYQCYYHGCIKAYKHLNGILNHFIISHVQLNDNDPKPFKCTIPNCDKEYKQALGLAYHLEKNHAEELRNNESSTLPGQNTPKSPSENTNSSSTPISTYSYNNNETNQNSINNEPKPYRCHYNNCFKSYKNPNGLAYHIAKVHQQQIGSEPSLSNPNLELNN